MALPTTWEGIAKVCKGRAQRDGSGSLLSKPTAVHTSTVVKEAIRRRPGP